ncbi:MAG TPA: tyrosine-type recombinase/integrase [Bryobacteraceae bacterium]|nr:tyrosine-type recombinase/integrase [Bryobacteraceae bacterium]
MVPVDVSPLDSGRHVGRTRWQRGWVEETGKKVKNWRGHYYVYVRMPDGSERRSHRTVTLGPKAQMRKSEAERKLQQIIENTETEVAALPVVAPVEQAPEPTVMWFWSERYRPMKEPQWKSSSRPKTIRFFEQYVLPPFGEVRLDHLDRFAIQMHLNELAKRFSYSVVSKFRVYMKAMLDEALEQDLIVKNPARKLSFPETRKPRKTVLSEPEIAELLRDLEGRDRLIVRMFLVLALRPGELFALRRCDRIEPSQLRVDESVSEELRGANRVVTTKNESSSAYVWLPESIRIELDWWLDAMEDQRAQAFIFATRNGTPLNMNNFLRRVIKIGAKRARARLLIDNPELPPGFLADVNHQVFRRTCATYLQKLGSVKDIQAHLRHATPAMTVREYMREIPASVRSAVESLDSKLTAVGRSKAPGILNKFEQQSERN